MYIAQSCCNFCLSTISARSIVPGFYDTIQGKKRGSQKNLYFFPFMRNYDNGFAARNIMKRYAFTSDHL